MTRGVAPRVGRPTKAEAEAREGHKGRVIRALGHLTRRQILLLLQDGGKPVHAIADEFDVSRPMISKHLSVLRQVGLVDARPVGRERHYRLMVGPDVETAIELACADLAHRAQLEQLRQRLTRHQ